MNIKRFNAIDRLFHIFVMLTFFTMTATGFGRLFITTDWGEKLSGMLGGYEACALIHRWVGVLMVAGFAAHILYVATRIPRRNLKQSIIGPDSLIPNLQDLRHVWQLILWSLGVAPPPELDRWTYWEKFDYWAVFWGLPLLAVTGIMMMYPLETCRIMPGWSLNVAALLHKTEAILAVTFIFVIHFFVQHLRPSNFPLNESIFSGTVRLEKAIEEKPAWVKRLKEEGEIERSAAKPPALLFRVAYFIFGYAAMGFGLYLMIKGIIYSRYVSLH